MGLSSMNSVGSRLKLILKTLNKSQQDIENEIGIARSIVSRIAADKVGLSNLFIYAFKKEYNINPDWLVNGEGEMFLETKNDHTSLDLKEMQETIEAVEEIFQENNLYLNPSKKAELIVLLYEYFKEDEIDIKSEKGQRKIIELARLAG